MNHTGALRPFAAVLTRDLRRQLLTGAQLALFALMALLVVLITVAPKLVGSVGANPPTVYVSAPSDVIAVVEKMEPTWVIRSSDEIPVAEDTKVGVVVSGNTVEVKVERRSQAALAAAVGERFATAMLVVRSSAAVPPVSYDYMIDDSDAVITRIITLIAALITFSVVAGRAAWSFGALSRDLSLGLFDAVFARSSAIGSIGGRVVAATVAGIVQLLALALVASAMLLITSEPEIAVRVLLLSLPLALWAGGGIALLVVAAMVLALLFRRSGTASLGIVIQLLGFGAFGILIVALLEPRAPWLVAASLIPPVSVILLPVRLAEGMATTTDAVIAAGAVMVLIAALSWLSLRAWQAATTTDDVAAMWRTMLRGRSSRAHQ